MEETVSPPQPNKKKIVLSIIGIIVILAIVLGLFFYFDSEFKLTDNDIKFDYDALVDEKQFDPAIEQTYTQNPTSIMDLVFDEKSRQVFFLDTSAHRVMVLDTNLNNVKNIGEKYGSLEPGVELVVSSASDEGREVNEFFSYPGAIDVDETTGEIVIIDRLNQKVKYFDSEFNFVKKKDISPELNLELNIKDSPPVDASEIGIQLLDNGNLLIYSVKESKIVTLDPNNLEKAKELSLENGRIFRVKAEAGKVYLIDSINNKVSEYDEELNFVKDLGLVLKEPYDLCIRESKNQIIIADRADNSLKVFDISSNNLIETKKFEKEGKAIAPAYIACDDVSEIAYVFDDASSSLLKINLVNLSALETLETLQDLSYLKGSPLFLSINPINEDIAFADPQTNLFVVLNSNFELKRILGPGYGDSIDKFKYPTAIRYDKEGKLYLIDRLNRKIKIYDQDYNMIKAIKVLENCPMDLIVLDNGNLVYADYNSNRVLIIDQNGTLVGELIPPEYDDRFQSPHGLAFYNNKYYVVDEEFPEDGGKYKVWIKEFDSEYNFIKKYNMIIPNEFGLSETSDFYGRMAIIPSNEENLLYFFDLDSEKIVKKLKVSHAEGLTAIQVDISPDESYAIISNQKDGKLLKIDINKKEIIAENLVRKNFIEV
jgi:DNA-binding beta-propeller fold protein YncE